MSSKANDEVSSGLAKLSLKTAELTPTSQSKAKAPKKKNASPVADSWEDEVDEDDEEASGAEDTTPIASSSTTTTAHAGTSAPPPTPMSPVANATKIRAFSPQATLSGPAGFTIPPFDGAVDTNSINAPPSKRPEKTDAVARRMIASALGMRAPRMTDEQKAYDRAVREKEKKRRAEEKERERLEEEEREKARKAIWDD
ncbi:hypothetical protein B0J18DRAFT_49294 [Chaetomium sp. MPI-SDFR-AT-0129]|nr:hypothetical protein B0J18DRAFT_49294 [Chaetomium sp. MPI-SDFR-AT-0129]